MSTATRISDETATRLPPGSAESREADAADIDGDGDLDIVVANVRFTTDKAPNNQLLVNDGTGMFRDATASLPPSPQNEGSSFTIRFFDVDGDGEIDILSPNNRLGSGGSVQIWLNDGLGSFAPATVALVDEAPSGSTFDIEVADFNGDSKPDLYFCNRTGGDQLYLG